MINSKFFFSEFIFIFEFFSRIFSLNTFYDIKKLLNIRWHKLHFINSPIHNLINMIISIAIPQNYINNKKKKITCKKNS